MLTWIAETKKNVSFQKGKLTTPFGTEYIGFKITIGHVTEPWEVHRTYEDIEKILNSDPENWTVHEERDEEGRFKSLSVST